MSEQGRAARFHFMTAQILYVTHIAGKLAHFGSVLKLWSLTEIDAVTFTVLQILLILHLQEHTDRYSRMLQCFCKTP